MSSIFKTTICKNEIITYLDDVLVQDIRTDTLLQTLDQHNQILEKNLNLKAAPDKSFFLSRISFFLGHQLQNRHIHPLKYKVH